MPIFDFYCKKCGNVFERIVKSSETLEICECGYVAKKILPNTFNFQLKGDCWNKDSYNKKRKDWEKHMEY